VLPCAIHLVFNSINTYCTFRLFHIALIIHVLEKFLYLKGIPADLKLDQWKKRHIVFIKTFFRRRNCTGTLHKVGKKVSFVICIPDWSLSCHLILSLLIYSVDFSSSEFCINSLPPESKAHTKLCIAYVSLSYQYNTCVSEKYELIFYFTQLHSSHLPSACLYKSQSSSVESLISTQLHMLMLHMEGS